MSFKKGKQSSTYKYMMSFLEGKKPSLSPKKEVRILYSVSEISLHYNVLLAMHLLKAAEVLIISFFV